MKKNKLIPILFFLIFIMFGCGEFEPNVEFNETIEGRTIILSNKVGDSFQIIRDGDTIEYSLSYDKVNRYNYLIKSDTDTVFVGTVTKRNELFLLNRPLDNGKFAIHALKFTDSTVIGLETEWLQSNLIKNQLDSGKYNHVLIDTTTGKETITASKKEGKDIFRKVIEKLEVEKLLVSLDAHTQIEVEKHSRNATSNIQIVSKTGLIKKAYPNPFVDEITIELIENDSYIFTLYNMQGKLIKTLSLKTDNAKLVFQNLKPGYYILKVFTAEDILLDEISLIKK